MSVSWLSCCQCPVALAKAAIDSGAAKITEFVLVGHKSGKHYQRTDIIAVLVNNKPIAPFVFNG